MNAIIDAAFSRARVVALLFIAILMVGALSYSSIPKESMPEVPIPLAYVATGIDGISPEDSERLLIDPLETELSSLTGLKSMTAHAGEGFGNVQLEFRNDWRDIFALHFRHCFGDELAVQVVSDCGNVTALRFAQHVSCATNF